MKKKIKNFEAGSTVSREPRLVGDIVMVYRGQYITVTRRDDGTYRPNLKPIVIGDGFDIDRFATDVANELLWSVGGLIEKE